MHVDTLAIMLQAAEMPAGSVERLLKVTAYAVGIYSNLRRTTKPFKDLLNSTFELVYPERGYRILGEKVCVSQCRTIKPYILGKS